MDAATRQKGKVYMTKINTADELRNRMAAIAIEAYIAAGYELMQTAGGTWYFLAKDMDGKDTWCKLGIIIPKNACEEEATDGYSLHEEYEMKLKAAAERKAKAAAKSEETARKKKKESK